MITEFRDKYSFLSNFYPTDVVFEGISYFNAESAFQSMKCFDERDRYRFCTKSGKESKILGRCVLLRPDWEQVKDDIMYQVVKTKFTNDKMKQLLLSTGDEELVEGNTWGDYYWGVCNGKGQNKLGKILMRVREELRNE